MKKKINKNKYKTSALIFAIIVISFLVLYLTLSPNLFELRNSNTFDIAIKIIITGLILFLCISKKINLPVSGEIILSLFVIILWGTFIWNFGKYTHLIYYLYALVNISCAIIIKILTKNEFKSIYIFGCFSLLSVFTISLRLHYLSKFPFWEISLLISGIATIISIILILIFPPYENQDRFSIPLVTMMFSFIFVWFSLCSINYIFDTSVAREESYVIIDKHITSGARQVTTYDLVVSDEQKTFTISVRETVYYHYHIGDTIELSLYDGYFNTSYYLYVD